ncbi:DNA polymerase lambda-like protein, partial [Globisporangium splendens]
MGAWELLSAAYEVSTVITDVVLNSEYIKRKWVEEYILSIAFLVFSGVVMGFVGVALETKIANRYVRNRGVNMAIAFLLGLLQLRVLVENVYVVLATRKEEKSMANQPAQLRQPPGHSHFVNNDNKNTATTSANTTAGQDDADSVKRLEDGLKFATFVQAIVRDIPIFIIQANATVHYRKWKFLDLWAVISTGLTLLHGVAGYICKKDTGVLRYTGSLFILGQFVLRAGTILLVATTTGHMIIVYALAITFTSIVSSVVLRIAHTCPEPGVQLTRALLFFPFFTLFVVDASQLTSRRGTARKSLVGKKLSFVHGWRGVESVIGILIAVFHTRYTDFGVSTDSEIAMIGGIIGGVFLLTALVFFCVVSSPRLVTKQSSSSDETEESSTITMMQAAGGQLPNAVYSNMAQLA